MTGSHRHVGKALYVGHLAATAAMMNLVTDPMILPECGALEIQQLVVPNGWGGLIQVEQASRLPRLGHR